jgi:hypothetical protein
MKAFTRFEVLIPAVISLLLQVHEAPAIEQNVLARLSLTRESGVTAYEMLSGGEVRKKASEKVVRSIQVPASDFEERIRPALQEGLLRLDAHSAGKSPECQSSLARIWVEGRGEFKVCEDDPVVREKIIDRARAFEWILSQKK